MDLTAREYEALSDPTKARRDRDFTADLVPTPPAWTGLVSKVVRLSRLRETKAMVGFTRADAPDWGEPDSSQRALLSKAELDWVPASTTHGEGIFLVLQPDVIARMGEGSRPERPHEPAMGWHMPAGVTTERWGARPRTTGRETVISCCIPFLICWSVK